MNGTNLPFCLMPKKAKIREAAETRRYLKNQKRENRNISPEAEKKKPEEAITLFIKLDTNRSEPEIKEMLERIREESIQEMEKIYDGAIAYISQGSNLRGVLRKLGEYWNRREEESDFFERSGGMPLGHGRVQNPFEKYKS